MRLKIISLVPGLEHICNIGERPTWVSYDPKQLVNSDAELRGGNCIQDACDPLVLPHYRIGSFGTRVSEFTRVDNERPDLWVRTTWANTGIIT